MPLREADPAGALTLVGDEPHVPYERPPLSKGVLTGDAEPATTYLRQHAHYGERGIDLRLDASVTAIDRSGRGVELSDGSSLAYDRLLIATGAGRGGSTCRAAVSTGCSTCATSPIRSPCARRSSPAPGWSSSAAAISASLEVAASARKRGCEAMVVELAGRVMNRVVAPEMSDHFAALHRAAGVEIRTATTVAAIEGDGRVRELALSDGTRVAADAVVIGVGIVPNVELAEDAGLEVDDGIRVDAFARTADPGIFAAGDATNHFNPLLGRSLRLESWQNAQNQAIAAARNMAGAEAAYAEIPWFWSDQHGVNLQMVGAPESWDQVVRRDAGGDADAERFTLFYLAGDRLVAANTVDNARDIRPSRRLIEKGTPLTAAELADPGVKMQQLVKR